MSRRWPPPSPSTRAPTPWLQAAYAVQLAKPVSDGAYLRLYGKWIAPLGMPFPVRLYAIWPALRAQVAKDPQASFSAPAGS